MLFSLLGSEEEMECEAVGIYASKESGGRKVRVPRGS